MKGSFYILLATFLAVAGFYFFNQTSFEPDLNGRASDDSENVSVNGSVSGSDDDEDQIGESVDLNTIEHISNNNGVILSEIKKELTGLLPLVGRSGIGDSFLTKEGVFVWTNLARMEESSHSYLSSNSVLDQIAEIRMNDMFLQQYFDHVSPQGVEVSKIAEDQGYEYIAVGENIALGNFVNDEVLVEAWMDSPGHRENILSGNYTELGIAVGNSVYEGDLVWIAVQVFGRPLSDCPKPDPLLNQKIDENKGLIDGLESQAEVIYTDIVMGLPSEEEHSQMVDEYNDLVDQINQLVSDTRGMIEDFNTQVARFNSCVSS